MEKPARRRHVPAFGEWNYYSSSSSPEEPRLPHSGAAAMGGGDCSSWWYAAAEPEACSDAWFRYSPPPRRAPAPKKPRRRPAAEQTSKPCCQEDGSARPPAEACWARASGAGAARATPAKGARRVVVRPVDADLYGVPPPDDTISSLPRRKRAARRSLWMGCLGGFNCVA